MKKLFLIPLLLLISNPSLTFADDHTGGMGGHKGADQKLLASLMCPAVINIREPDEMVKRLRFKSYLRKEVKAIMIEQNIKKEEFWNYIGTEYFDNSQIKSLESWEIYIANLIEKKNQEGIISNDQLDDMVELCDAVEIK